MELQLGHRLLVGFLIAFYSGLPGLWIAEIIRKKDLSLFHTIKNFELTKNLRLYKLIGIDYFAYIVKNTFFRHFNTKIRIPKRPNLSEVDNLLNEITISELCHIFGFILVLFIQIIPLFMALYDLLFFLFIFNTIFNAYPVLLQERNKLRLKKFLKTL